MTLEENNPISLSSEMGDPEGKIVNLNRTSVQEAEEDKEDNDI